MTTHNEMRIGVIGAGARSKIALVTGECDVRSRIVAVADNSEQGAQRAIDYFGEAVTVVPSVTDIIGLGLDAAFITTPDHTHAQIACELLRAGVAVYVEKPLGISTAEADEILTVAYETGTKLYVGHNMRHMPVIDLMRKLIADGAIGEVKAIWCRHFVGNGGDYYFKDWHAERSHTNGLLLQKGAHDLDVIHWLGGGYSRDVVGMGDLMVYGTINDRADNSRRTMPDWFSYENWPPTEQRGLNPIIDVEDLSMVQLRLNNGVLASYEQCHFTPDYWRNYTVIGTEGRLENEGDSAGGVVRVWNRRTSYNPDGDAVYPIPDGAGGHNGADRSTVAEFLHFLRDGAPTETSPIAAREAVAAGDAATISLRNGSTPQRVPEPPVLLDEYFNRGQISSPSSHLTRHSH